MAHWTMRAVTPPPRAVSCVPVNWPNVVESVDVDAPLKLSLERALEYISSDEYVEATPKNLRLRKKELDENKRKRAAQSRQPKIVEN